MSTVAVASPSESPADRAVSLDARAVEPAATSSSALIVAHVDLVDQVLGYLCTRWPSHVDRDDLYSAGQLALVECAERWNPEAGVPFAQYARQRIKGSMLDALRDADWAPRSLRERVRLVEEARASLRHDHGREASDDEIAAATDLTSRQVVGALADARRARVHSIDVSTSTDGETSMADLLLCPATGAEQRVEDLEMRAELAGALAALDDRARTVVVGIYLDQRPLVDIGRQLGVSESRISQIHRETLRTLDGMLRRRWEQDHGTPSTDGPERRARHHQAAVDRYRAWHAEQHGRLLAATT